MATAGRPGEYVCGIDAAMDLVGGQRKALILWALDEGPVRLGELCAQVPGVSADDLAARLGELEADGVVLREVPEEGAPGVAYSLTPLGVSLNEALAPLGAWGRRNLLTDTAGSRQR